MEEIREPLWCKPGTAFSMAPLQTAARMDGEQCLKSPATAGWPFYIPSQAMLMVENLKPPCFKARMVISTAQPCTAVISTPASCYCVYLLSRGGVSLPILSLRLQLGLMFFCLSQQWAAAISTVELSSLS